MRREAEGDEAGTNRMCLQCVDAVAIGLVALRVRALLLDDAVEGVSRARRAFRRSTLNALRGMRVRSSTNCFAGTLTARNVARVPTSSTSPRTHTGFPHARRIFPGAVSIPTRRARGSLPLIAPDLQVDVDDVVVGDRDTAKRVRDRERACLVAGVEVPDDARGVAALLDAERPRLPRLEARLGSLPEGHAALRDRREHERLAVTQRDVAVPVEEIAGEGDLEPLADAERAVRLHVDGDVGLEQGEAVGVRDARKSESCDRDEAANQRLIRPRPRSGRL